MIYEIRVTLRFIMSTQPFEKIKSTIIEYIESDNIIKAYLKAGELKHDIAIGIAKHISDINEVKVYLDAVVAKPELNTIKLTLEEEDKNEEISSWKVDTHVK